MHDGLGDIKNPFSLSCVNEEFASGSVSAWASLSGRRTLCSKHKTSSLWETRSEKPGCIFEILFKFKREVSKELKYTFYVWCIFSSRSVWLQVRLFFFFSSLEHDFNWVYLSNKGFWGSRFYSSDHFKATGMTHTQLVFPVVGTASRTRCGTSNIFLGTKICEIL